MAGRMAVPALLAALALAGCGNMAEPSEQVGRVGVTVDPSGRLLVMVAPCRSGKAKVTIARGRTPDMPAEQANEPVGEWTATAATGEVSTLDLGMPAPDWLGEAVSPPTQGAIWIVDATFDGEDGTVLRGPTVTGQDLAELPDDSVLTAEGTEPSSSFDGDC